MESGDTTDRGGDTADCCGVISGDGAENRLGDGCGWWCRLLMGEEKFRSGGYPGEGKGDCVAGVACADAGDVWLYGDGW